MLWALKRRVAVYKICAVKGCLFVFYRILKLSLEITWNGKYKFKLIYFRSIAKQVITTYINHSRPLIPDGIHLFIWTRVERREKPDLSLYAERQARKRLPLVHQEWPVLSSTE